MATLDNSSGKYRGSKAPKHVNARAKAAMMIAVDHHRKRVPQSQRYYERRRKETQPSHSCPRPSPLPRNLQDAHPRASLLDRPLTKSQCDSFKFSLQNSSGMFKSPRQPGPSPTSGPGGNPEVSRSIPDIREPMSGIGAKLTVVATWPEQPVLAKRCYEAEGRGLMLLRLFQHRSEGVPR